MPLGACSSAPRDIQTAPIEVERPPARANIPLPSPISTRPVQWVVVTSNNLPPGDGWVIIGLTPDQYENLSMNTAEMLRWAREAGYQLRYYRGDHPAPEE